jgi:hypothetical protein
MPICVSIVKGNPLARAILKSWLDFAKYLTTASGAVFLPGDSECTNERSRRKTTLSNS